MVYIFESDSNNDFSCISNESLTNKDNKINLNKMAIKFKSIINQNFQNYNRPKTNIFVNTKNKFLILLTIFILLIKRVLCESYIILTINKEGKHNILFHWGIDYNILCSSASMHIPKKMIINGELIDPPVGEFDFYKKNNIIKLVYEDTKNNFKCLFYGCSDIDEIDVSHLITSNVNNMA